MEDVSHGILGFEVPGPLEKLSKSGKIKEKHVYRKSQTSVLFSSGFSMNFMVFGLHLGLHFSSKIAPKMGSEPKGKHFLNDVMFFCDLQVPQGEIFLDSGVDFHGFR